MAAVGVGWGLSPTRTVAVDSTSPPSGGEARGGPIQVIPPRGSPSPSGSKVYSPLSSLVSLNAPARLDFPRSVKRPRHLNLLIRWTGATNNCYRPVSDWTGRQFSRQASRRRRQCFPPVIWGAPSIRLHRKLSQAP